jgi:hypothetical protein
MLNNFIANIWISMTDRTNVLRKVARNSQASLTQAVFFATNEKSTTSMVALESNWTAHILTASAIQARDSRDRRILTSICDESTQMLVRSRMAKKQKKMVVMH